MHEVSLMSNLLAAATAALQPYRVTRVNSLTVRAGILANVLPGAFEFAFASLSAGTMFELARLSVEKAPLTARCTDCGAEYESWQIPPLCPVCGSGAADICGGTEVVLAAIDFDGEDE